MNGCYGVRKIRKTFVEKSGTAESGFADEHSVCVRTGGYTGQLGPKPTRSQVTYGSVPSQLGNKLIHFKDMKKDSIVNVCQNC